MSRVFRLPMYVIAAALLGLIALLATLQYRWVGQISGAEREHMTATLNEHAKAFAEDVDRELTRAYLLFQLDISQPDGGVVPDLVTRYERWQATARFPRLIKDVYFVGPYGASDSLPLQRFNPSTHVLESAAWPPQLGPVRAVMDPAPPPASRTSTSASSLVYRASIPSSWPGIPALVVPAPLIVVTHTTTMSGGHTEVRDTQIPIAPQLRYTILLLDGDYIRTDMLPALAHAHFRDAGEGIDYRVAVVPTKGDTPVYRSAAEFAPRADAQADARADLFQVRPQDFAAVAAEVNRFAMFTNVQTLASGRSQTIFRETLRNTGADVKAARAPFSIVLGTPKTVTTERVDQVVADAKAGGSQAARWRLLVQHPSGSLEQYVNAARRRNLAISTSVLGVLAVSVGFLMLSTRRAHDLARQQLEFVATVSHELRTPLAVIRSAADNLADGVVHDEARVKQYGELVRREGVRLTDLVEQILEFAGLQSGQRALTVSPIDIGALLREIVVASERAALAAGVSIEITIAPQLPAVAGDEAALRRVFQNLIGNAIKYGASGGWVGITGRPAAGGGVEVDVSDRGIGIAAADQCRIFDPFYRAPDVVSAQFQGAGLGLSLVKRIVEAHDGRVHVTSAPGQVTSFTVILPLVHGDGVEGPVATATPQHS